MTTRITWTDREGLGKTGWSGKIGKKELFVINLSVSRRGQWVLRTSLPVTIRTPLDLNADADELKALAERVLSTFVSMLGASFDE